MKMDSTVGELSKAHISVVVVGAIFFSAANLAGLGGETGLGGTFSDLLYSFNLLAIITAVGILFLRFQQTREDILLLAGLASLSWFMGSFFWVSYAYMLGEILTYPSLMQVAFNGFHLLMIPLLIYVVRESGIGFNKPSLLFVGIAPIYPVVGYVLTVSPIPGYDIFSVSLNIFGFNIFFITVGSVLFVLAVHLIVNEKFILLGLAFVLFFIADVNFMTTTMFDPEITVFALDPLWFTAHSLLSFSLVRYSLRGDLP